MIFGAYFKHYLRLDGSKVGSGFTLRLGSGLGIGHAAGMVSNAVCLCKCVDSVF